MTQKETIILGIESSCDDTSAAILKNETILSNLIAGQDVHREYGGVVPELASRAHLQSIVPVVDAAIKKAGIQRTDIDGVAFTKGPGLLGSLVVGTSFAKSFALAMDIPLIDVNHMYGHVLAHFIDDAGKEKPQFPFLCLTVSGGHTQIVRVKDHLDMEVIGTTIDDAAGEAFDKIAKLLGFEYPGGPFIDKYAVKGNPDAFSFGIPKVGGLDYSFSGLKTSVLYFLQKQERINPSFIEDNLEDLCASVQRSIINILFKKLILATEQTGIVQVALAGGVSANSELRSRLKEEGQKRNWKVYIPKFEYCTDNAAMIAITGKYMFDKKVFCDQSVTAQARINFNAYKAAK
ncbi:MAG: tRNA (adenosine(37)-N6)-threonylcarbamoyltransferase complex transferase subunit TsaD [Crocinitomicaceae bacterium]|nr:tRNA (adenosine(37)-N6)-threonylcarbamoyltransferase complex transferase subunit TsaD [Crocinitomicaceae bacterium]